MTRGPDYELEALLSLDGQEFRFAKGHVMKFEVRKVVRYAWSGPVDLLDGFFREIDRFLHEGGVS